MDYEWDIEEQHSKSMFVLDLVDPGDLEDNVSINE